MGNNTRMNPDKPIGKENFAAKLAETQLAFYKPSIIVSSFKASGIYPICRDAVADESLRPSLTFGGTEEIKKKDNSHERDKVKEDAALEALNTYKSVLSTPVRDKYEERLKSDGNMDDNSPGFTVYQKLKAKAFPCTEPEEYIKVKDQPRASVKSEFNQVNQENAEVNKAHGAATGLYLLAEAADQVRREDCVSPLLQNIVKLPKVGIKKPKAKRLSDTLPDSLTSKETIRKMALASLKVAREKADKEEKAKEK